jgi:hypothetical protein
MMPRLLIQFFCLPLLAAALVVCDTHCVHAYPNGQLYWTTNEHPNQTFLYSVNPATFNGAFGALDYACQQRYGSEIYIGEVQLHLDFPAEKDGYCLIYWGIPGDLYTAYLYCNGVMRDWLDDSPCYPVADPFPPENNYGPPQCP